MHVFFANSLNYLSVYFCRCIHSENWKEIPVAKPNVMDSDQFCQKKIDFARHHSNSEDHHIKCCITNTAGTRCSEQLQLPTSESKP